MKKQAMKFIMMSLVFGFVLLNSLFTFAQSGGSYEIKPSVIAGGGARLSGGTFTTDGTIGQSVLGASSGGTFSLDAGFWNGALGCLSLSRTSQSFTANGGTGSLNVSGLSSCSWTATSNDNWISITSGGSGSGDGIVTYAVAGHSFTAPRSGTLTIANQIFTVVQGAAFLDVPVESLFYTEIGKLSARGVTLGCGGGNYCPDQLVKREQMAAFIMRALGEFNPPAPATQRFNDVPSSNIFYPFIDRMAVLQITLGCGVNPPLYCPGDPVLREQMAAFIIRALGEFSPPTPASQRFNDVPPSNVFYAFIDRMAVRGITFGCSANPPLYCPTDSVTRAQMAAFLVRAFDL